MGSPEADQFLDACKLTTERGSFVATVFCPLYLNDALTKGQLPLAGSGLLIEETFSRKVVRTVLQSVSTIVDALDNNRMDSLIGQEGFDTIISANMCEALAQTEEMVTETNPLVIEARLSPMIPSSSAIPTTICLRSEHYPAIRSVAMSLRPRMESRASRFIGQVVSLHGGPGADDLVGGDIVLAFIDESAERLIKARVGLPPADYKRAAQAHVEGHYVAVSGLLERAPRVSRIKDPTDFTDMSTADTSAETT
jgi:hypothetical protein